jgi:hypothetical protein
MSCATIKTRRRTGFVCRGTQCPAAQAYEVVRGDDCSATFVVPDTAAGRRVPGGSETATLATRFGEPFRRHRFD